MSITPGQCRAARALLNWKQSELVARSGVSQAAIANFERGASTPYPRTLKDLRETFEKAGLELLEDGALGGIGVRFKAGVTEPRILPEDGATTGTAASGLRMSTWDEDFDDFYALDETALDDEDRKWLEFIRTNPELSDNGRRILMKDAVERYSAKQQGDFDGLEA